MGGDLLPGQHAAKVTTRIVKRVGRVDFEFRNPINQRRHGRWAGSPSVDTASSVFDVGEGGSSPE
jgi:hypothetical protein